MRPDKTDNKYYRENDSFKHNLFDLDNKLYIDHIEQKMGEMREYAQHNYNTCELLDSSSDMFKKTKEGYQRVCTCGLDKLLNLD